MSAILRRNLAFAVLHHHLHDEVCWHHLSVVKRCQVVVPDWSMFLACVAWTVLSHCYLFIILSGRSARQRLFLQVSKRDRQDVGPVWCDVSVYMGWVSERWQFAAMIKNSCYVKSLLTLYTRSFEGLSTRKVHWFPCQLFCDHFPANCSVIISLFFIHFRELTEIGTHVTRAAGWWSSNYLNCKLSHVAIHHRWEPAHLSLFTAFITKKCPT